MKPGPRRPTPSLLSSLALAVLLLGPARAPAALVSDAPVSAASWPGALAGPDVPSSGEGVSYARYSSSLRPHAFRHPDRLSLEIAMGLVGGVVGGALGVAGSFLIPCGSGGAFDASCGSSRLAGFVVGGLVGFPVGVWVGGGLMKGEGSLWATLLGSGVGAAGTLVLLRAFPNSTVGYFSLLLPMTFSIVAYEVTHALRQPPPPQDTPPESPPSESPAPGSSASLSSRASRAPRLQPLVALTTGGALVGLGGHF